MSNMLFDLLPSITRPQRARFTQTDDGDGQSNIVSCPIFTDHIPHSSLTATILRRNHIAGQTFTSLHHALTSLSNTRLRDSFHSLSHSLSHSSELEQLVTSETRKWQVLVHLNPTGLSYLLIIHLSKLIG
eukprot:GHVN01101146.1.p1 GENE.GHVN01101146.1~~GHVN01101146.1.p1  ORF type:complete len:130 (+),score=23.63 GHVN01101146.1:302-691(+)